MAIPAQCPACARFLSRSFLRRAVQAPQPCPKCARPLTASLDGDVPTIGLADAPAVVDGVGATPVAEMTAAAEQPGDVVDTDELAQEAEVYAAGAGDDVVDREGVAAADGAATDGAATDGAATDDAATDGGATGGRSTLDAGTDEREGQPPQLAAVEEPDTDALPVASQAAVPIPAVPAGDQADAAAAPGGVASSAPGAEDGAPTPDGVADVDRDPLAGWDVGSSRDVAELPQQGNEAIVMVVSAVTAGAVLGAFSGRRRLLRSVLGAVLGALAAAGVRRAGAGRDLRRP